MLEGTQNLLGDGNITVSNKLQTLCVTPTHQSKICQLE